MTKNAEAMAPCYFQFLPFVEVSSLFPSGLGGVGIFLAQRPSVGGV